MTDDLAPVTRIPTPLATIIVCQLSDGIECEVCDRPGPVVHAPEGIDEARQLAADEGWHVDADNDIDVCPTCLADGHAP